MDPALTPDDFRACDWPAVITAAANKECEAYFEAFRSGAEQAHADGRERNRLVFELLKTRSMLNHYQYVVVWRHQKTAIES
jgi:hypothetical protein